MKNKTIKFGTTTINLSKKKGQPERIEVITKSDTYLVLRLTDVKESMPMERLRPLFTL